MFYLLGLLLNFIFSVGKEKQPEGISGCRRQSSWAAKRPERAF